MMAGMETTMSASSAAILPSSAGAVLDAAQIATYRRQGFLHTPGVLSAEESEDLRKRYLAATQKASNLGGGYGSAMFDQYVNLWQQSDPSLLQGLILHPRMRALSTQLAGEPLRVWHDHLLNKRAKNGVPTEWHQDQPYWPHANSAGALSAWVALVDVPQNRGCMSYLPGSHSFTELEAQNLGDETDLFRRCPELQWQQSVTVPVKAGDVVWHHARTAHRAEANRTDTDRVVVSVIYMPQTTRFTGGKHICTEGRDFVVGELLTGDCFPVV